MQIKKFTILLQSVSKETSDSLAQLVEHNTFNVGVLGSSPKRITGNKAHRTTYVPYFVPFSENLDQLHSISYIFMLVVKIPRSFRTGSLRRLLYIRLLCQFEESVGDVAVAAGVLVEVVLMHFFGRVEVAQREDFDCKVAAVGGTD